MKCFKLPYVGSFSTEAQRRLRKLVKCFYVDLDIKLAFSSFEIRNMFNVKDPVPFDLLCLSILCLSISVRVSCINSLVQDVMPVTSGKHPDTF